MSGRVFPLEGNQRDAVDPQDNVWLSASAGTGKTQVLSARVLRLLLREEVDPSAILCLTFTKAGAAEMANRINAVLARWVRLEPAALAKELGHLGADIDPATQARARTLFASVLDCPGGGLRIDTIHAFSQWLIASFPEEAGLQPGAQPMDDRTRELLARDVLTAMIEEAHATGDERLTGAIADFVTRKDPSALRGWLLRCAAAGELWEGPAGWQLPLGERVRRLLEIPADADESWAAEILHPDTFPDHQLAAMLPAMQAWKVQTGRDCAAFIPRWLSCPPAERAALVACFCDTILTKKGEPRQMKGPAKQDPRIPERQQEVAAALALYHERRALLGLAALLEDALTIGRAFALRWDEAKRREGLLEFDDLIRNAARLLSGSLSADWIRYKLDRRFDHILIDEAQDTNRAQWDIVEALIDDFFAGEGAHGDRLRTIFTVGDYKQAIFGFQGTSPENFARAKDRVRARIEAARANIQSARTNRRMPRFRDLDLGRSYRTSRPVLDFVNAAIETLGHEAFGLDRAPGEHRGAERPGLVTLWQPVRSIDAAGAEPEEDEQDWLPRHDTLLAEKIAHQVERWVKRVEPFVLAKGEPRHAQAGDVMVLVRKRKELAAQIVAKLHTRGVPVAGVDRLRLGQPLAVRDLLAALRFAAQVRDDLALACLLVSPLMGWTQDDLLAFAVREKGVGLWDHLRRHDDPFVKASAERLRDLLALADYQTPQALLAWLLTGPWRGRAKLVARLGREANDPIDELLNAAFAYESAHPASLAGFLEWFDAGATDLKRDSGEAGGQVRVMTVHGSKGLQAPIVILADATGEPGREGELALEERPLGEPTGRMVPVPALSREHLCGRVAEEAERSRIAGMQEHWRLLYVAMTRAEEALFIGGSLGPRHAEKGPPQESWYARLAPLFGGAEYEDAIWGTRRELGHRADPLVPPGDDAGAAASEPLPAWAMTPVGPEPRPPRPLAPSGAGEERGADPPLAAVPQGAEAAALAARRGTLIHRLLERLPDIAPPAREEAARRWLARQAGDLDEAVRAEMAASALAVLANPAFAAIFSDRALAEVPLAATIGGIVVAGTADRLLVGADEVTVVDFKTTRRPPARLEEVPAATLRQMAAYAAALGAIHPGRRIRAALLYTHAPLLIELPPETLAAHKRELGEAEETYPPDAPMRLE
ncbi:double-strand break repair helicase AddA [Erythrobacter sp. HL-111]|uniref:double-strand break repair helicase AddA n=1 Tax=Erythrobacter sp. HL-111 TaxID=1798193 RepID=UPI0006DB44D7|nr:double-strand break repair helicase AddA [Erythrobacter sp. HL-111]KPP90282.1 MAG: double-strand break repair helicase AddA [Erythrobacteraceae bacterium HL-111]SDR85014.1 DNA helicase/exodeoxyribonuclease V, subunit A [Erythrobacter sp. HL-111]